MEVKQAHRTHEVLVVPHPGCDGGTAGWQNTWDSKWVLDPGMWRGYGTLTEHILSRTFPGQVGQKLSVLNAQPRSPRAHFTRHAWLHFWKKVLYQRALSGLSTVGSFQILFVCSHYVLWTLLIPPKSNAKVWEVFRKLSIYSTDTHRPHTSIEVGSSIINLWLSLCLCFLYYI